MELPTQYLELKKEVEDYFEKIQSDDKIKSKIDNYFKGIQVLFSPLKIQPKIMFIGINPGAGYFNYKNEHVKRFSPLEKMEYTYGKYRLAQQTRELFKFADLKKEDLKDSVKSNCFFFATKNEKELGQLLSHLKPTKVYNKSEKWIDNLVSLIRPKIIICEGKSAFNRFLKNKECRISENNDVLYAEWNEMKIIGYKRFFSNIIGINHVANKLKECTK